MSMRASPFYGLLLLVASGSAAVPVTAGIERDDGRFEFSQVHMGMPVRLVLHAAGPETARPAAAAAFDRIAALDRMMSDYRDDSETRRLGERPLEWVPASAELFSILGRAVEIAGATGGAFDPTVAPLVALWREARKTGRLPERSRLDAARALVGWRCLELDSARRAVRLARPGMRLDLGGIAKGFVLQEALGMLRRHGISSALLEAGGDIVVGDPPPGRSGWRVETPSASRAFSERAANLRHSALATSGPTAQFVVIDGVRYSHVIDPRTGLGVTNHVTARVIAEDAATADALATALTVIGLDGAETVAKRFAGVQFDLQRDPK
jgi:thiamine biosynthesis lipoprotein